MNRAGGVRRPVENLRFLGILLTSTEELPNKAGVIAEILFCVLFFPPLFLEIYLYIGHNMEGNAYRDKPFLFFSTVRFWVGCYRAPIPTIESK